MFNTLVRRLRPFLRLHHPGGDVSTGPEALLDLRIAARRLHRDAPDDTDLRLPEGTLAPVRVRHAPARRYRR